MESLKGAIAVEDIVHEHDGFRQQLHDIELYLVACLPAGAKWGFEDAVVLSPSTEAFEGERLEKLIENIVATCVDHVSILSALLQRRVITKCELSSYIALRRAWLS